jgi:hypothetical protein
MQSVTISDDFVKDNAPLLTILAVSRLDCSTLYLRLTFRIINYLWSTVSWIGWTATNETWQILRILWHNRVLCRRNCFPAVICFPCPPRTTILPNGAVAFVVGSFYFSPNGVVAEIEARHMEMFPGDISLPTNQDILPSFRNLHISCVGTVCGPTHSLQDQSLALPVYISKRVHGKMKFFQLMYIFLLCRSVFFFNIVAPLGVFSPAKSHDGSLRLSPHSALWFK